MFNEASQTGFLLSKTKFSSLNDKYLYLTNVARSLYSLEIILKLKNFKPVILTTGNFFWIFVVRITIEKRALI